jgi:hypothetical protein
MHIDESRRDDKSVTIHDLRVIGISDRALRAFDLSIGNQHIADFIDVARWVEDSSTSQEQRTHRR